MDLNAWILAWLGAPQPAKIDKIKLIGFVAGCAVLWGEVIWPSHDTVTEAFGVSKSTAQRLRLDAIRAGMLVSTGEYHTFGTASHLKIEKLRVGWPTQ